MLRILLVDDDPVKCELLRGVIRDVLEGKSEVVVMGTAADAGRELGRAAYDLMLLDLQIPMRTGEDPRPDGGVQLLRQLEWRRDRCVPPHVIGVTAYEDLAATQDAEFEGWFWRIITVDGKRTEWVERLSRKLLQLAEAKEVQPQFGCDLAILTALDKVELENVLRLPAEWRSRSEKGDDTPYYCGTFARGPVKLAVVAAAAYEMGMPASTALAMKMIGLFRPKYLAMVGIAAGVEGRFGDILIADHTYDYGSGKTLKRVGARSRFRPAPSQLRLNAGLRARLSEFARSQVLADIEARWTGGPLPAGKISARIGPIASGASVVQGRPLIDEIVSHNRKVVGVEMEAYGVFVAASACTDPRPLPIVVKSVCDFGDEHKGDDYQDFAGFTAAQFLYEFALERLGGGMINRLMVATGER